MNERPFFVGNIDPSHWIHVHNEDGKFRAEVTQYRPIGGGRYGEETWENFGRTPAQAMIGALKAAQCLYPERYAELDKSASAFFARKRS